MNSLGSGLHLKDLDGLVSELGVEADGGRFDSHVGRRSYIDNTPSMCIQDNLLINDPPPRID